MKIRNSISDDELDKLFGLAPENRYYSKEVYLPSKLGEASWTGKKHYSSSYEQLEHAVEAMMSVVREGSVIIDIGCGKGRLAHVLNRISHRRVKYIGLEIVPERVAEAKAAAPRACKFFKCDVSAVKRWPKKAIFYMYDPVNEATLKHLLDTFPIGSFVYFVPGRSETHGIIRYHERIIHIKDCLYLVGG